MATILVLNIFFPKSGGGGVNEEVKLLFPKSKRAVRTNSTVYSFSCGNFYIESNLKFIYYNFDFQLEIADIKAVVSIAALIFRIGC